MNAELITKAAERIETLAAETKKSAAEIDGRLGAVEQLIAQVSKAGRGMAGGRTLTFGQSVTKDLASHEGIRRLCKGDRTSVLLEPDRPLCVKALVSQGNSTSSDDPNQDFAWSPSPRAEMGRFVHRQPRLLDFLPFRQVDAPTHVYIRTRAEGDAAEQVLEGSQKASIELATQAITTTVATIAAHTSMSTQLVQDVAEVSRLVDQVLRVKVLARLEHLLINGTGGQGSIDGLISQSEPFTPSDAVADADIIGEAIVAAEDSGYSPNVVLMSAADWYRIRIERESGTGAYVFGSPAEVRPPALWGRTVVTSATMPAGQALVLDTTFITLLDRMAPTVMVSTQHASNFTANLATVLCELRAGLQVGETGAVLRVELSSAASSSSSE